MVRGVENSPTFEMCDNLDVALPRPLNRIEESGDIRRLRKLIEESALPSLTEKHVQSRTRNRRYLRLVERSIPKLAA